MSNMTRTRIGKCPSGHMAQMVTEWTGTYSPCGECVLSYRWSSVKATVTESECDGDCQSARGDKCACACGGRNHGAAWVA